MPVFYRNVYTELWITLSSNEVLGILDSSYLEDYYGIDGQITLRHESGQEFVVPMSELASETPGIPNDVFTGFKSLDVLPNGNYEIRARVRDIVNNYTIIGSVENPIGSENVISLPFTIAYGISNIVVSYGPMKLMGGVSLMTTLSEDEMSLTSGLRSISSLSVPLLIIDNLLSPLQEEAGFSTELQEDVNIISELQSNITGVALLQDAPIFDAELRGD